MANNELKALRIRRGHFKTQMTSFEKVLNSINKDNLTPELKINLKQRLQKIEPLYDSFNETQTEIEYIVYEDADLFNKEVAEGESFYDTYFQLTSIAQTLLFPVTNVQIDEQLSTVHPQDSVSAHEQSNPGVAMSGARSVNEYLNHNKCSIKLPTISLPTFDGTFTSWRSFLDAFNTLICANQDLTNIQRLTYLKSAVKGEPYDLISTLETTEANYNIAIDILKRRYDNKRRIINNHVLSILNIQSITRESAMQFKTLINSLQTHMNCLRSMGLEVDSWDAMLVPLIINKLDNNTAKEWETKLNRDNSNHEAIPLLSDLIEFLTNKLVTLEIIDQKREPKFTPNKQTLRSFATVGDHPTCPNCHKEHSIQNCKTFLDLNESDRNKKVRNLKLCINCLRSNHFLSNCQSSSTCRICHKRHHTLLHLKTNKVTEHSSEQNEPVKTTNETKDSSANYSLQTIPMESLLSTAVVHSIDTRGEIHNVRILLDSASQSHFITETLCERLNLKRSPVDMNVSSIGKNKLNIKHSAEITIKSRVNDFSATITCLVVPNIANAIPTRTFEKTVIDIPVNIKLADPNFNQSSSVDLLIGVNVFWSVICIGQIKIRELMLQKTKLGWILAGQLLNEQYANKKTNYDTISCLSLDTLNKNVERFWNFDEFNFNSKKLTPDEELCENNFMKTTERDENGRFIVKIPFKENMSELSNTYEIAKSRFETLEKRFNFNKDLKHEYATFMNEYINANHMTKIENIQTTKNAFYLPHHCVYKQSSETTKLRVVFDGSCKNKNELSLNEIQHTGPILQNDIFSIISRFRLYKFVITADIAKMYRQIWVNPEHRQYQRILWRENANNDLATYELNTVTYGTTSAPFLAVRCLMRLAEIHDQSYPEESRIIRDDFYVDDLITGCDDLNELIKRKENIIKILDSGGFELRKFRGNHSTLTEQSNLNTNTSIILNTENKTLGVGWNPNTDMFSYSFNLEFKETACTKRTVLALTAQLYDPLGLIAPAIVVAKLIIQELWQLKLSWDETIPMNLFIQWNKFKSKLKFLNNITIPRKILVQRDTNRKIELHIFSDASEKAYGTCIYVKSYNEANEIRVALLAAKSRVAPIKKSTLPRLELCAAVLGAQLADKFKNILKIKIDQEHFWSDSQITLAWIKSDPNRWKPYVLNRVTEIQRLSNPDDWHYVKSADNPADLISRGLYPELLLHKPLWWQGPEWLANTTKYEIEPISILEGHLNEQRKDVKNFQIVNAFDFSIENYSNLTRLTRTVAYCCRFINNTRMPNRESRQYGSITNFELTEATLRLIKIDQENHFTQELHTLTNTSTVHRKSKLISLSPFLDKNKIIRVGGRLKYSNYKYEKKHPILLPSHSHFTKLIIKNEHERLMHASPRATLNSLREKYWPVHGLNATKRVIHDCIKCARIRAQPITPIMGELPYERTVSMHPFHTTGIDYAGPFLMKDRSTRGAKTIKCYICLYICFSTKAIHLELVSNLTTDAFLLSFKRFIARKGRPLNVYSDNGSNFVGANHELEKLGKFLKENANHIQNSISVYGVQWNFIPPRSPTFGGLWEAGIKNVKYHLKRVLSNVKLTFEEFNTIIIQIESVLNSRPITPLTSDPNDLEPLTPAHFLIGRTFTTIPDPDLTDIPQNRLNRYQLLQQLNVQFWKRWATEYIHQLQQRTKWRDQTKPLEIDQMVILRDNNLPPAQWRLGRVVELHPGHDGVIRVISVKCAGGIFKRAVNRVCVLPVEIPK